jgi:ribosomal protein S25
MSGFLPRFVFVTAEPIMKNLRPMGPPTTESLVKRAEIIRKLQAIRSHYADQTVTISVNGNVAGTQKKIWEASLTDEAWHRVNRYSEAMIDEAMKSVYRDMLVPTFDRLNKSGLKIATLLAACRNLVDKIVVEDHDIISSFYYVERLRLYAIEVIENLGKNPFEKLIDKITQIAAREPGVTKSKIMRMCQLTARSAEEVLTTMAMRGLIKREPSGPQGKFERIFVAKE